MNWENLFQANDIRGIYPEELSDEAAFKIGQALVSYLQPQEICIGRDVRLSSESLFRALSQGIIQSGIEVIDLGVISTDAFYFAVGKYNFEAGVMITASHNPSHYNGFKICRQGVKMLYEDEGLMELKNILKNLPQLSQSTRKGKIVSKDISGDYLNHILSVSSHFQLKDFKIGLDLSNGALTWIIKEVCRRLPITTFLINEVPDGTFPHHFPDSSLPESWQEMRQLILHNDLDFGVVFDGDGDRITFLDNEGKAVEASVILVILTRYFLSKYPNSAVVYDSGSSPIVLENILKLGGKPIRSRIGHSFMKTMMREHEAAVGGEHTGHFYFKDHYYSDSGLMTLMFILGILSDLKNPLSVLRQEIYPYYHLITELNYPKVKNYEQKLQEIVNYYQKEGAQVENFDGYIIKGNHYWIQIHPANTAPVIRVNLETDEKKVLNQKEQEIKTLFKQLNFS